VDYIFNYFQKSLLNVAGGSPPYYKATVSDLNILIV